MSAQPAAAGEPEPAPSAKGRNLPIAIVTGLSLAGLIFGTLFTSRIAWEIVVIVVVTYGLSEFYAAVQSRGYRPATWLGLAASVAMMAGASWRGPRAVTFVLAMFLVVAFLWYLADPERRNVLANISVSVFGLVYTGVMGAHVILMRELPHGPGITIAFIGLVAFYDIGAFASGSLLGKRKLAPSISPGKTWEGAIGASVLILALGAGLGPLIEPWSLWSGLALAGATAVVAPLGDLAESVLKRDLQIKDFGQLLPGHGGMLDRIDALLLMAPVAYWLARWLTI
ncbi:MAG TPA: phosphatidate cytidylyltransferase [Actinomycetota bacterium]|nr:phosphatidate cytidylyltransferase [Actinomycetota bacterium]